MNLLIVDDQKEIAESLKNDIDWASLNFNKVFTAASAKEAKMIMRNFPVEALLTDIEMPEEDGLSLFKWVRENYPDIEGVFLTSHADFAYAQKAMHMGGFDYILQPARYGDIEETMRKLCLRIKDKKDVKQLENMLEAVQEQRNNILSGLLYQMSLGREESANQLYGNFPEIFKVEGESCIFPMLVKVQKWRAESSSWNEKLMRLVFSNVIEELFEAVGGKAAASSFNDNMYMVLLVVPRKSLDMGFFKKQIEAFYKFIDTNMDFRIAVFPLDASGRKFTEIFKILNSRAVSMTKCGIFWDDDELEYEGTAQDPIAIAKKYISENLNKNISRTEVAELIHLNEEYFSRLFKQGTGLTFKDYIQKKKIDRAKILLTESSLSISIVASKVGYDNLSHFSKMFRKITGYTPQEYRKKR